MWVVEDDIRKILNELPSECSYLDYKIIPYSKDKKHDFVKDVIAMLNSPECVGEKKYIIFGVSNDKRLIGISEENQPDDNEFQNWADNIMPRPQLQTGTVLFKGNIYGYVYILNSNEYVVYEVRQTVTGNEKYKSAGKNVVLQGQAFLRRGSRNDVMMQADREFTAKYISQKIYRETSYSVIASPICNASIIATLIGTWDENRPGDCKIIESIYENDYSFFKKEIRNYAIQNQGLLVFANNVWKINNRCQMLDRISSNTFDDQIEKLKDITCNVVMSTDPFLGLLESDPNKSTLYNRMVTASSYTYSESLRDSLFEFWCYAGNKIDSFTSLSKNKIKNCLFDIIKSVIHSDDWKILTTNSKIIPLLAEAYPEAFLKEVTDSIKYKEGGIHATLFDEGRYSRSCEFANYLSESLGLLATYEDTFSRAGLCLVALVGVNEVFLDKIASVMMPWFPQTEVETSVRRGFLKAAFIDYSDNSWKLLISLLPGQRTNSYSIGKAIYLPKAKINGRVNDQEYWDEISGLISLACINAKGIAKRYIDLISLMTNLRDKDRREILKALKKDFSTFYDDDKYIIWVAINDLINKNRRFKDAEWTLQENQLNLLEETLSEFEKEIWLPKERILFRNDQWQLLEHKEDYIKDEMKIFQKQVMAIQKVYEHGIDFFTEFLEKIENLKVVGAAAVHIEMSQGIWKYIPDIFKNPASKYIDFARSFIKESFRNDKSYLKEYLKNVEPETAIKIYEILPITKAATEISKAVSIDLQKNYWDNVEVFGFNSADEELRDYVIDKLVEYGRADDVFRILYTDAVINKIDISPEFIAYVLIKCSDNIDKTTEAYIIECFINKVEDSSIDDKLKTEIEWKYLELLTHEATFSFKSIYRMFSKSPDEFMRVFSMIHRGESEEAIPQFNPGIYSLLDTWHVVPGTRADGSFDGVYFDKWIKEVLSIAEKTKRIETVKHYIGKLLFYSPASEDGLFIDKSIARLLQSDDSGHILNGYLVEALNSRGFHWVDETGNTEFILENEYRKKAKAVEIEGFTRFADTLRIIAQNYHDEALYNIEEAQKWKNTDE